VAAPPSRWTAVWAVFAAGVVCGAYIGKVPPALPLQRAELDLTLVQSSFIATMFNVMGGLVGMLAGVLCDRYGHKRLGLAGLATLALAGALGAFAQSFAALLAARFFEGVGFILFTVCGTVLIVAAVSEPRERAKALGLWSAYMPSGGGLALLLAPWILGIWGWRGLWLVFSVAAAACFVIVARVAPSSRYGGVRSARLLVESLAQPANVAFALLFAFYVAQWTSVMIWLPTFLVEERGASQTLAAMLTLAMVLINVPGNLGGGWLLAHGVRRSRLVLAASVLMGLTDAVMLSSAIPDGARYLACLAFSMGAGVIPAAIFSGIPLHARTPQHIGTANGMVMQTSQAGQFFGPLLLAWLASGFGGWGATLWAMLVFAAGVAGCALALARVEARRARER
jgi:MFS family permease